MNLKTFGKKVGKGIRKNLPKILVCGSIAGMVTSVQGTRRRCEWRTSAKLFRLPKSAAACR